MMRPCPGCLDNGILICLQCDGRWHDCFYCGWAPAGYRNATESDETLLDFLKEHPLTRAEETQVGAAIQRLKERLKARGKVSDN